MRHHNSFAELSVIFYDDINYVGASYSGDVEQGVCSTLPGDWLDRAESVQIDSGYSCFFYTSVSEPLGRFLIL